MDVGALELLDVGYTVSNFAAELEINRPLAEPAPALQRPRRQAPAARQLLLIEELIRHCLLRVARNFDPELITSQSCGPWELKMDAESDEPWDRVWTAWGCGWDGAGAMHQMRSFNSSGVEKDDEVDVLSLSYAAIEEHFDAQPGIANRSRR